MNYVVQGGAWAGNQLGIEWLQPVKDDHNGFHLERQGSLYANWMLMF